MDNVVVYYESWQMQCCGEPFGVGDTVSWRVALGSEHRSETSWKYDFIEDHHCLCDDSKYRITGRVERIAMEFSHKEEKGNIVEYDKIPKQRVEVKGTVNGWDFPENTCDFGYYIKLSNVKLELAKDNE